MASALQTLTDTIPVLRDGDHSVRIDALRTLHAVIENGGLEPDVLAKYADHIVPRLEDEDRCVRRCAFGTLCKLEPGVFAKYADHIIPRVKDEYPSVRLDAVDALGKLEPGVLAEYAFHIVSMLNDERYPSVRGHVVQTLGYLKPDVFAKYARHVVPMLDDAHWWVRFKAVYALGKLEPEVLAKYAHHIILRLDDEDDDVCRTAFDLLAKVPLVALVPHRHALQALQALQCNDKVADKFRSLRGRMCSLRGRVWLVRLRQLFWCQRLVWYWGSRACRPGSRQARAAASEFGRMQGVSAEEGGEREVKRARVE